MSSFLDKLRKLSPEKKNKIAFLSAVFITFIVLIFYIVYIDINKKENKYVVSEPLFDGKQFQEIKNNFNNLFK